jgi:hypothetical protein
MAHTVIPVAAAAKTAIIAVTIMALFGLSIMTKLLNVI